MGFDIGYIIDILKFPWPLFPKYKQTYPVGLRYDIPGIRRDFVFEINLPPNKYELQSFVFSSTGYKDGDSYSLIRNDEYIFSHIFTKELGQVKEIRPVRKIETEKDTLTFVYHNNTGTSKVIWIDLDFTCQTSVKVSDVIIPGNVSSLAYFFAQEGDPGYINESSINTAYWMQPLNVYGVNIRAPFWEGRNDLLTAYSNSGSKIQNLVKYHLCLFKLVDDAKNGITVPQFSLPWVEFKDKAKLTVAEGGLGLTTFNDLQLSQIYLSQMLHTPVNIFQSAQIMTDGNRIDFIKQYLKSNHMFVFDWIDFNDVEPEEDVGGFNFDPSGFSTNPDIYLPLASIKSYINIEPSSLNLTVDYSRTAKPREYYFPEGATSWIDAHYHAMDGEHDPLEVYDLSVTDPAINVAEVFTHEMGHAIDFYHRDKTGRMFSQDPEWLSISGWNLNYFELYEYGNSPFCNVPDYKSNLSNTEPPVSNYGASHPAEDFAETYALYCCNPRVLMEQFPLKWQFMESHIKDMMP